jgi:hypothetical protein
VVPARARCSVARCSVRVPAMSGATVFFPRGGDVVSGEEGLGRPPIFRVRVWIRILFRFKFGSAFLSISFPDLDLHLYKASDTIVITI